MALPNLQTVTTGFPSKGVDSEVETLGKQMVADGAVRSGPENETTKKLVANLRAYGNQKSVDRKLKSRTVNGRLYFQFLNEPPKRTAK